MLSDAEGFDLRDYTFNSCVWVSEYPKLTDIKSSSSFHASLVNIFNFFFEFLLLLFFSVCVITPRRCISFKEKDCKSVS